MTEIELKIGDVLRDNDPRQEGRTLEITKILPLHGSVRACSSKGKDVRILQRRIHTDGKARKSGYSLVREAQS